MGTKVTMKETVKVSWIELRAADGRFWRFSTEEEARKFAQENGLILIPKGEGHHG